MRKPNAFLARFTPLDQIKPHPVPLPTMTIDTHSYRAALTFGQPNMLTISPDRRTTLLLAGQIYRPQSSEPGRMLLDDYQRRGQDFLADINGTFTLLLVDQRENQILLATDRANSSKLLVMRQGEDFIAANAIELLPQANAPLDRTAIAAYLSMSYIYNQRTVFANVSILDGASVYRLEDGKLIPHKYWHFVFNPDHKTPPQDFSHEFGERLVEAVRLRVRPDRPTYISLSGGYDSPGILSVLAESLHVPDVRCVTYAYGTPKPGSDETVSAQLAAFYGYSHQTLSAYDGTLIETLKQNGRLGGGLTRPADEIDAWLRLGSTVDADVPPVMFSGTTHLHKPDWEIRSVADAVASAHMFDFSLLSWLEPYLGAVVYSDYVASTHAEIDEALRRVPATNDGWDRRDMLRYDQIHSRQALTWREYFTGRFFVSANPLLDDDLVELLLRIPSSLRRGRRIYLDTIRAMFPAQFALPRATSASYSTFWPDAIAQNRAALRDWIRSQSSPLDDVIAPDILLAVLNSDLSGFTRSNTRIWSAATQIYRLLKKAHWHHTRWVSPSLLHPVVSATTFLVRALTLRSFLTEFASSQSSPAMLR